MFIEVFIYKTHIITFIFILFDSAHFPKGICYTYPTQCTLLQSLAESWLLYLLLVTAVSSSSG